MSSSFAFKSTTKWKHSLPTPKSLTSRPLVSGAPRMLQFVESRFRLLEDYVHILGEIQAEELTEKVREAAKNSQWAHYHDKISVKYNKKSAQFYFDIHKSIRREATETLLASDSVENLFRTLAGTYLTDQSNAPIVESSISTGSEIGKTNRKINDTLFKALSLSSKPTSAETIQVKGKGE